VVGNGSHQYPNRFRTTGSDSACPVILWYNIIHLGTSPVVMPNATKSKTGTELGFHTPNL